MKTTSFLLILMSITAAARAQAPGGTWSGTLPDGSALSVTLKPAGGKIGGTVQRAGTSYQLAGSLDGEDIVAVATSGTGALYLEAHAENGGLRVIVAPMNAQGDPDYQRAVEALLKSGGVPATAAAPAPSGGGNPLARASAAADPFAGKFSGDGIVMAIAKEGDGYKGTLETQGTALPFTAQSGSRGLTGTFSAGGTTYMFEARLQGNVLALTSDGQTHSLQRQGSANPLAAAAPSQAPATAGPPAQTAQDQQLAQLLLSRRWCAFSFSSGGGSSGRSSTEKIQFFQDGTVIQSTGGESYYSGSAGSVASDRSGGTRAMWKVEGGGLHVSADGAQWKRVNLKIEPNSNGSPIMTADGREYMVCS